MGASGIEARTIDVRGAGGELHLVRDLLDNRLVDRRNQPLGRADGLVIVVPAGGPPRLASIETGMTVLDERLGSWVARPVRAASRRWGMLHGRPTRIPWSRIERIGIDTELDLDADASPSLAWEHWLREHVVRYLPSLKSRDEKKHPPHAPPPSPSTPPGDPTAPAPPAPVRGKRVRLHRLLNRKVLGPDGQPVGRIEEIRAHVREGQCLIDEYLLGREGLMERLSVHDLSLVALRFLGAQHGATGHRVPWHQLDLSHPHYPRLRCRPEDLAGSRVDRS
jgi:sporulation protein YlmC with PRC-barrel domain